MVHFEACFGVAALRYVLPESLVEGCRLLPDAVILDQSGGRMIATVVIAFVSGDHVGIDAGLRCEVNLL